MPSFLESSAIIEKTHKIEIFDNIKVFKECGTVAGFYREGTFALVQYDDAEALYQMSVGLNDREIAGETIKVILEEKTEKKVEEWKRAQRYHYHSTIESIATEVLHH